MAKKRKITPKHLAALRAAGKKRRGKKRGPYKQQINPIENIMHAITDYVPYDPNTETKFKCMKLASKVYLNADGHTGHYMSSGFLKFTNDLFVYVSTGKLPELSPTATNLTPATSKEPA